MFSVEALFFHGWGFDQELWRSWSQKWKGIAPSFGERGYFFKDKKEPLFVHKKSFKIIVTHSLGLHFVKKELLQACDLLVVMGGFIDFVGDDKFRLAQIRAMQRKLISDPKLVLEDFYALCDVPLALSSLCNSKLLGEELLFLNKSRLDLKSFHAVPNILIFHGGNDQIVSLKKGQELSKALKNSFFFMIPNAGHFFPLDLCISEIEKFVPKTGFKQKVIEAFSCRAQKYDEHSILQKRAAHLLAQKIPLLPVVEGPALEIGSATGYTSSLLLDFLLKRKIILSDISLAMVKICEEKFGIYDNFSFWNVDGEEIERKDAFALIFSTLVFQWFENFSASLKRLFHSLKPGGCLAFSFLTSDSFPEWKKACALADAPYSGKSLPEIDAVIKLVRSLDPEASIELYEEKIEFDSPIDFFTNLKMTGASASDRSLTISEWKRILKKWQEISSKKCLVTYTIAQMIMKRS